MPIKNYFDLFSVINFGVFILFNPDPWCIRFGTSKGFFRLVPLFSNMKRILFPYWLPWREIKMHRPFIFRSTWLPHKGKNYFHGSRQTVFSNTAPSRTCTQYWASVNVEGSRDNKNKDEFRKSEFDYNENWNCKWLPYDKTFIDQDLLLPGPIYINKRNDKRN